MARDATYQPGVYRLAGGNKLVVSTTVGTLDVESGGKITVKSGGYLTLDAGSHLSSTGAVLSDAITVGSTGTLTNNGTISSSGTVNFKAGGTVNQKGTLSSTGTNTIASGGTLTVNAGATLSNEGTLTSTGTITNAPAGTINNAGALANTGTITNSSDGQIRESVEVLGPAGAIKPYGISVIGTTAGATAYTLAKPPAAGVRKTLICKQSTGALLVRCSSSGTLNYGANRKITFAANADGYALELLATTSTNWQSIRNSTAQVTTIVYGTT